MEAEKDIQSHINLLRNLHSVGTVQFNANELPAIASITLVNSQKRNAMSPKMIVEFHSIITQICNWLDTKDPRLEQVVALVLQGHGNSFCAGFDLDSAQSAVAEGQSMTQKLGEAMSLVMTDALNRLSKLPLITVSLISGPAFGGGAEITTATDFRIMHVDAIVRFVHVRMGLTCAWGGISRLTFVSRQAALFILGACEKLTAHRALELKYCDLICFDQDLLATAQRFLYPFIYFQTDDGVERKQFAYPVQCVKRLVADATMEHEQFMQLWGARDNLEALKARRRHL